MKQNTLWDHPRRCGENYTLGFPIFIRGGSPPQVRGKLRNLASFGVGGGITPAGAGKTGRRTSMSIATRITPAGAGKTNSYLR